MQTLTGQSSYYPAQTYDLARDPSTFSTSNGTQAFTAGVAFYARLDTSVTALANGDLDVLFAPGSGTAGVAYAGLYFATGTAAAGKIFQIGSTANLGGQSAGVLHQNLYGAGVAFQNPNGVLYAAVLVATEAQTNKIDFGRLTAPITLAAYTTAMESDPTGGGGFPRAMKGAGTGLTALPANEAMSGITVTDLIFFAGIS
jgi:hypothetical protein